MPQCRWVMVDATKGSAPFGTANDRAAIFRLMQQAPEAERENCWVLDRLAQDRAPFDSGEDAVGVTKALRRFAKLLRKTLCPRLETSLCIQRRRAWARCP